MRKIFQKVIISLLFISFLQACAYQVYTSRLPEKIVRATPKSKQGSDINIGKNVEEIASIGDVMFVITRYLVTSEEVPVVPAPRGLTPFPLHGAWFGTHSYSGPDGEGIVYSSPQYYRGQIGVILDEEGLLVVENPFVCLWGPKAGRKYRSPYIGVPFFDQAKKIDVAWGLRYGGRRGDDFQFEVIDQANPKEIEVVQEVMITESEFYNGFVVKGVLIKGVSLGKHGLIHYTVDDIITD